MKDLIVFLLLPFLADKKFSGKPPRFSCLLPDPRELIEIKNKKKVCTYKNTFPCVHMCTPCVGSSVELGSVPEDKNGDALSTSVYGFQG